MKSTNVIAPTFYKNELVKSANGEPITGWRRSTDDEQNNWYAQHAARCAAGSDVPYDDAGEPKLSPRDAHFSIPGTVVLTITRGRVSAPIGYHTAKDCCQVFCPINGETLYVKRKELTNTW